MPGDTFLRNPVPTEPCSYRTLFLQNLIPIWVYDATKWRMNMKKTALLLTTCCALVLAGCSATERSTNPTQPTTQSSESQTSEDNSTAATTAPDESTAAPEETTVALGDKMTLADWTITAKKVTAQKKIQNGKYQYFQPKKGNTYLVVSLSVRNEGKQAEDFLPMIVYGDKSTSATLFYQDGYEYKPTQLIAYDKDLTTRKVQPLSTEKGIIAFEVPKKVAKAKKNLKLTFNSQGQTASYTLK